MGYYPDKQSLGYDKNRPSEILAGCTTGSTRT
jgi:hypothetical protein